MKKGILLVMIAMLLFSGCAGQKHKQAETSQVDTEMAAAQELVDQAMALSIVDDAYLTPSGALTNAIVKAVQVQVVEAETDRCRVRITYPDVKTTFLEMLDELPENLEQHDVDTFYDQLREKVTGGKLPVLETSLDLAIMTNSAGEAYIEWTPQAQNAMTGGLYEAFYEEADGA